MLMKQPDYKLQPQAYVQFGHKLQWDILPS